MIDKNTKTTSIDYAELARRVGDCVLNNNVRGISDREIGEWDVFNGEECYCYVHETKEGCNENDYKCEYNSVDIYQDFIIPKSGAEYLQRNTNEIVFYNQNLDMYIWGITHWGTSWDGVFTNVKTY